MPYYSIDDTIDYIISNTEETALYHHSGIFAAEEYASVESIKIYIVMELKLLSCPPKNQRL